MKLAVEKRSLNLSSYIKGTLWMENPFFRPIVGKVTGTQVNQLTRHKVDLTHKNICPDHFDDLTDCGELSFFTTSVYSKGFYYRNYT